MHLLLTNDDGIDAPGLQALYRAARKLAVDRVTIAAPATHLSGCSHQATTDQPIQVRSVEEDRYAVNGTPVDCVRIALQMHRPDWVVSGINDGGNLGVDVFMSGTVAAAREAALHGLNAVALSQYRKSREDPRWDRSQQWAEAALTVLLRQPSQDFLWNVNFPDVGQKDEPNFVMAPVDTLPLPNDFKQDASGYRYRGRYHERDHRQDSDVAVCFGGHVAVSALSIRSAEVDLPADPFN